MARKRAKSPPFVMLPKWVVRSPAWRALSANARAVYLELRDRFNGHNNGMIGLGVREAAEATNMHKNTANRAVAELEAAGFIEPTTKGAFRQNGRRATEWLLTELPDDRTGHAALKTFMSRKIVSPSTGTVSPHTGTQTLEPPQKAALCPSTGTETSKKADLASLQRDTSRSTIPPGTETAQDAPEEAPPAKGARSPEGRTSGGSIPDVSAPPVSSSLLASKLMRGSPRPAPKPDYVPGNVSATLMAKLAMGGGK